MSKQIDIDPIVALVLDKVKAKPFRNEVAPGSYSGRGAVEFDYELNVGEDYVQKCYPKTPWKEIAMVALGKLDEETLQDIVAQALDKDGKVALALAVKPRVDVAIATLTSKSNTPFKGKVTVVSLRVSQVGIVEEDSSDADPELDRIAAEWAEAQ